MTPKRNDQLHTIIAFTLVYLTTSSAQTLPKQAGPPTSGSANLAPRITQHPLPEMAYRPGEDLTLPCIAESDKEITFTWTKDGQLLNLTENLAKYETRPDQGSVTIRSPSTTDSGVYQCFARTSHGTALSTKTTLKAAVLESFHTVLNPLVHRPILGHSLNLSCNPPKSYPTGHAYWGRSAIGAVSSKLEGIDNDDRVLLDYNGGLYFANILQRDSLEQFGSNLFYVCVVNNKLLGKFVKGNEQRVVPVSVAQDNIRQHAPQIMWTSPVHDKAIQGDNKRLKCIFSGLPTPRVSWRRLDVTMTNRVSVTPEGHQTEIEIQKVDFADSGRYECTGTNALGAVSQVLTLTVESRPYWRQNRIPSDVEVLEDDPVEIECIADGSPRPLIEWRIDGILISDTEADKRRRVEGNRISYDNVTIEKDRHVFQCLATNEHGQILANMALKIQAFSPSFLLTPLDTKVVQGRNVTFQCRAAGAPRPTVTWRDAKTSDVIRSDRFTVLSNGNLEIEHVTLEDSGSYECHIRNKFGSDFVRAILTVRSPTTINKSPQDLLVNITDDVTLQCDVTTDPAEQQNLKVTWKKNGEPIDYPGDARLIIDPNDFSLTIKSAEIDDTAVYACQADNGLDAAVSRVGVLTVLGPPEPPMDVHVTSCTMDHANVTWRPARENNDPVRRYIVYYNRTDDTSGHVTQVAIVTAQSEYYDDLPVEFSTSVAVHPWATFHFFVVAENSLGASHPSEASNACVTPQMRPTRNPSGVCVRLQGARQLTIVWEGLPREEWNGEGFRYLVGYRILHGSDTSLNVKDIRNPRQTELVIHDQESFRRYEIYVQAANDLGSVPLKNSDKRIGYSGEGKPSVVPTNVRFNNESLNSTSVELTWNSVDTNQDKMNGFFRGYRIEFWRVDREDEKRSEDIILVHHFDLCPPLTERNAEGKRRRRHYHEHQVTGSTSKLWPNSHIKAGVMALNVASYGRLSDTVEFRTPEGVPGAVARLNVTEAGSNHLLVEWTRPVEENGFITSYILTYQIAPPNIGSIRERILSNSKLLFKILDLSPSASYNISLSAVTRAGNGPPRYTTGTTLPQADPSKPEVGNVDVNENSANISWIPAGIEEPGNPGSKFYLEYRDKNDPGGDMWNRTDSVTEENWINVTGLKPGRTYEFRVVAVNGLGEEEEKTKKSDVHTFYIPAEGEKSTKPLSEEMLILKKGETGVWWFIVLMCIVILLLVVLFIICLAYHNRGQMYPVYEKERLWGSPHKNEEQPFGEYTRQELPMRSNAELRKSRESLESDQKPLDSDSTDSLGDYDDTDQAKFNEDGSFIGTYNKSRTGTAAPNGRGGSRHRRSENSHANTYV